MLAAARAKMDDRKVRRCPARRQRRRASRPALKEISGLLKTEDGEVTRGEMFLWRAHRRRRSDKDRRRGIIQVMERPPHHAGNDVAAENLRLGAVTRSDNEVGATSTWSQLLTAHEGTTPDWPSILRRRQQMLAIGRAVMARPKKI